MTIGQEGGLLVYPLADGASITLEIPAQAISSAVTVRIAHLAPLDGPSLHGELFASFFSVTIVEGGGQTIPDGFYFYHPATLHIHYTDAGMSADDEESLALFRQDPATQTWQPGACSTVIHDVNTNELAAPICQPGSFGVFVAAPPNTFLPLVAR